MTTESDPTDEPTRLTDFDAENPPEKGMLFKASSYEDDRAPIIRFEGQRETEVAAGHPGGKHAGRIAADPDINPGTVTTYKLRFSTFRPGGFWDAGDTKEIDDGMYDGRDDLLLVDEEGVVR